MGTAEEKVFEILVASYREIDKIILTLSTGALGLSLVFLEKVFPTKIGIEYTYLKCSWILLVIAILSTVVGQFARAKHLDITFYYRLGELPRPNFGDYYERHFIDGDRWNTISGFFSVIGRSSFILGIIFTFIFAVSSYEAVR